MKIEVDVEALREILDDPGGDSLPIVVDGFHGSISCGSDGIALSIPGLCDEDDDDEDALDRIISALLALAEDCRE